MLTVVLLPIRLVAHIAGTAILACLTLVFADAEALLFGDSPGSHLKWIALASGCVGLTTAALRMVDLRSRATSAMLRRYKQAFVTGVLPDDVDVSEWRRWLRGQRLSNLIPLVWVAYFSAAAAIPLLSQPYGFRPVVLLLLAGLAVFALLVWVGGRAMASNLEEAIRREDIRRRYG